MVRRKCLLRQRISLSECVALRIQKDWQKYPVCREAHRAAAAAAVALAAACNSIGDCGRISDGDSDSLALDAALPAQHAAQNRRPNAL